VELILRGPPSLASLLKRNAMARSSSQKTTPTRRSKTHAEMKQLSGQPLSSYSHDWKVLKQEIVRLLFESVTLHTKGTVKIPEGNFLFEVAGVEMEGTDQIGLDVQYPWDDAPRRYHHHRCTSSFLHRRIPVTNAEFKRFLDDTHYHPQDDLNFLTRLERRRYPDGWDNRR